MGFHGYVTVDVYLEVADLLSWFDVVGAAAGHLGCMCCWREEAHQSAFVFAVFTQTVGQH